MRKGAKEAKDWRIGLALKNALFVYGKLPGEGS
jgi:hypothetical protein